MKKLSITMSFAVISIFLVYGLFITSTTKISLDVNPSISIEVKKNEKIKSVKALNDDASNIIKDLKLDNVDLNTGLHAIIGSMYKNGYISDAKNSILVSVEDGNNAKKMEEKVTSYIDTILSGYNIKPSVMHQVVDTNNELKQKAEDSGITSGKAKLIEDILSVRKDKTFDDLKNLSVQELNLLLQGKEEVQNVKVTGEVSTSEYIKRDKALEIAVKDALNKLPSEVSLTYSTVEMDFENGIMVYEVDYSINGKEYEYEINAKTGDITKKDVEYDDDVRINQQTQSEQQNVVQPTPSQPVTTPKNTQSNNNQGTSQQTGNIGRDKALQIAYNKAGVSSGSAYDIDVEYEFERRYNAYIYEVSFNSNRYEYEVDIDAKTGNILNYKREFDD